MTGVKLACGLRDNARALPEVWVIEKRPMARGRGGAEEGATLSNTRNQKSQNNPE